MKQLNKGFNTVKNIVGSSYIIEIDELSKKYQNTLIILDNNHQIDALYNELSRLYKSKKFLNFQIMDLMIMTIRRLIKI